MNNVLKLVANNGPIQTRDNKTNDFIEELQDKIEELENDLEYVTDDKKELEYEAEGLQDRIYECETFKDHIEDIKELYKDMRDHDVYTWDEFQKEMDKILGV